jgi:hypothetical protein
VKEEQGMVNREEKGKSKQIYGRNRGRTAQN